MNVAMIEYNAGNTQSVTFALNRLGIDPIITSDPEILSRADKVIFPGVGEASSAMNNLRKNGLDLIIPNLKQPVLGICIGLQLLCKHSEEGNTDCLGVFDIDVKKFPSSNLEKIPQMGWNEMYDLKSPLFEGIPDHTYVYYVHSFYAEVSEEHTIATTSYGLAYSAALQKDNFYAVQFHTEKSSDMGGKILENFLRLGV